MEANADLIEGVKVGFAMGVVCGVVIYAAAIMLFDWFFFGPSATKKRGLGD